MPKSKKKIKVRDQKPLKDVKGGRHHHRRITTPGGGGGDRPDPPNIRHQ
jgi:hypothetical protein